MFLIGLWLSIKRKEKTSVSLVMSLRSAVTVPKGHWDCKISCRFWHLSIMSWSLGLTPVVQPPVVFSCHQGSKQILSGSQQSALLNIFLSSWYSSENTCLLNVIYNVTTLQFISIKDIFMECYLRINKMMCCTIYC